MVGLHIPQKGSNKACFHSVVLLTFHQNSKLNNFTTCTGHVCYYWKTTLKERLAVKVGCIWQLAFHLSTKTSWCLSFRNWTSTNSRGLKFGASDTPVTRKRTPGPHTMDFDWLSDSFFIDYLLIQKLMNNPMFGNGKAKTAHFIDLDLQ